MRETPPWATRRSGRTWDCVVDNQHLHRNALRHYEQATSTIKFGWHLQCRWKASNKPREKGTRSLNGTPRDADFTHVERVEATERLLAPKANVALGLGGMKCLVALTIMLPRESLLAVWPLADVWPLLCMRPQMPAKVESSRKRASASRHWAHKVRFVPASISARNLGCARRDLLFLHLQNRWEPNTAR